MIQFILIPLLTFFSLLLSAQPNCVASYYNLTNQAELAICEQNLKRACKLYEQAFQLPCNMAFTIDLGNALTVSGHLKNWKKAKVYAQQIVKKDFRKSIIKKRLADFFPSRSTAFIEAVEVDVQLLATREALRQLTAFDQTVRKDYPGYPIAQRQRIQYIDSIAYRQLIYLIEKNGGWLPEIAGGVGPEILIVGHNAMWQRDWIKPYMDKALKKGKLHPDNYAYLIREMQHNIKDPAWPKYNAHILWKLNGKLYLRTTLTKEVATARKAIYLDNLEEERIKHRFQVKHPEYNFSNILTFVMDGFSEEKLQEIIERVQLEAL